MTTQTIDAEKAAAFAGKMVGIMNGASLAFMTSIGHRTGLFDSMARMAPSTSEEIAANDRIERAVRTGVAGRDAHGRRRRLRSRDEEVRVASRACDVDHACSRPWQPRVVCAVLLGDRQCRDRHRRSLQERRRRPVLAVSALPGVDARGERGRVRRDADDDNAAAGARADRATPERHRRRGRWLRRRTRHQPDGEGVPEEPLHRIRLLGRRRCGAAAPRRRSGG